MKRLLFFGSMILLAAAIIGILNFPFFQTQKQETEKISGAYEALNFMGDRQVFPEDKLPERSYYAAWESMQEMSEATPSMRDEVDPWESMGPHNRGGRTLALAMNPQNTNTLLAGSASGGLWRSYSGGVGIDAWERVPIDFPVLGVSSITYAPGDSMTIFIGTGEVYNYYAAGTGAAFRNTRGSFGIGILRTTDGGETWEKSLDWSLDQNHGVWTIRISPTNPDIIYAATTEGVYKSTDGGDSWGQKQDVIMANDLLVHSDDPDIVVVGCGNFATPGHGIYKTNNGGDSWVKITSELPQTFEGKIQLGMAPSSPNIIYASIGNGFSSDNGASWLCRSSDFGSSWDLRSTIDYSQWQGWFSHDVAVSPDDPNEITVIGIEVWNSNDGGTVLIPKTTGGIGFINPPIEGPDGPGNFIHSDAHDVIYHPTDPDIVYVASDGGVHRSLDGGDNYASCNGRYQTAQFYNGFSTSVLDAGFCMGGLQDNGTIYWNGDLTWSRLSGGDGSWTAMHPQDDDEFYTSWQYLNILKTDDGQAMWEVEAPTQWPTSFIAPFMLAPSNGDVVYAASSVMAKSTDGAASWSVTNNGNTVAGNGTPILSMAISHQDPDVVYAATAPYNGQPSQMVRTLNGNIWTNITNGLPNRYPMDMAVDPTDDGIAYVTYSGFGGGHVYKTTNHGSSWTNISDGLPDVPTNAVIVDPLFPNTVYVGNDLGVFVSQDGGDTWATFQDGLPNVVMVFDLKISPINRKLRVATHGNGAYQRDLIDVVNVSQENVGLSPKINVFPNPATRIVNIDFPQSDVQAIVASLFDASGKMVRNFGEIEVGGTKTIQLDLGRNVPGTYLLQLDLEGEFVSKKLLIQ